MLPPRASALAKASAASAPAPPTPTTSSSPSPSSSSKPARPSRITLASPSRITLTTTTYRNRIHLSPRLLQALGIRVGAALVVTLASPANDKERSIRWAGLSWPSTALPDAQVLLPDILAEDGQLELDSVEGTAISVKPLDQPEVDAASLHLRVVSRQSQEDQADQGQEELVKSKKLDEEERELVLAVARETLLDLGIVTSSQRFTVSVLGIDYLLQVPRPNDAPSQATAVYQRITRRTQLILPPRIKGSTAKREKQAPLAEFPQNGFEDLGGLDKQIDEIRTLVQLPLMNPEVFEAHGLRAPRGLLLFGPPGTGKTSLARAAAVSCGVRPTSIFSVSGPELSSSLHGGTEAKLRALFGKARRSAPSVIVMDEIDALAPRREAGGGEGGQDGAGEVERRTVATLLTLMDGLGLEEGDRGSEDSSEDEAEQPESSFSSSKPRSRPIVVIAATNRPNAIDPALRRPGRLDREIEIGIPTSSARRSILEVLLRRVPHSLSEEEMGNIAAVTHGYVGADLSSLVREAGMRAIRRKMGASSTGKAPVEGLEEGMASLSVIASPERDRVSYADFRHALTLVRASAMREIILSTPTVRWSDIAPGKEGLAVQARVRECVEWPLKYGETMKRLGLKAPRGVLLYGPPGCSKTLIAQALASESGLNFIAVKGPELYNKYVGESERALRDIFRKARSASPSIIFFDEIDALTTTRGAEGASGVSDRIIATLLNEMDGIEVLGNVLVVAATNRPEIIDPALLRPGRLDRLLYVGPPDLEARRQILALQTSKMVLAPDVDLDVVARLTDGCSGAEVASITQEAGYRAMQEDLLAPHVDQSHLEAAARGIRRRITPQMVEHFKRWREGAERGGF